MTEDEKKMVAKIHASNYRMLDELDRVCRLHGIRYYLAYGGLLGAVRHGDFIPWDDDVDVVMTHEEYAKLREVKSEFQPPFQLVEPDDYGEQSYDMVPRINDTSLRILGEGSATSHFYKSGLRDYAALDIFLMGGLPAGITGLMHKVRLAFWYGVADTYRNRNRSDRKTGLMKLAQDVLHAAGKFTTAPEVRRHFWKSLLKYPSDGTYRLAVLNDTLDTMKQTFSLDDFEPAAAIEMKGHLYSAPRRYKELLSIFYGEDYMQPPPEEQRRPKSMNK